MTETNFCTKCGAEMRDDMNFCPKCGAVRAGSATEKEREDAFLEMATESRFMWLRFLLIIYAVPAILIGITQVFYANVTADSLWASEEFRKMATDMGLGLGDIASYIKIGGGLAIISGLGAAASLYSVAKRKMWIVAFVGCLIATIFSIWSLFGVFVGIFVCWMIYDCKPLFVDNPKTSS